jgi:SAM-dependent methyltransferase
MFTPSDLLQSRTVTVIDPECIAEMARQMKLYQVIVPCLENLAPVGYDLDPSSAILDLACGPGSWVLDVAFALPEAEVAGVDSSRTMIDYANARACSQGLTNASFGVMDITRPLDFSEDSFDLITGHFLLTVLEEADWPSVLKEGLRLLKVGGAIRLTECIYGKTTSGACEQLSLHYVQALARAGLRPTPAGLAHDLGQAISLADLLLDAGYQDIKPQDFLLDFSAGSPAHTQMCQIIPVFFELIQPFVLQMQVVTETAYARLCHELPQELAANTFGGHWHLRTLWGRKAEAEEEGAQAETESVLARAGGER